MAHWQSAFGFCCILLLAWAVTAAWQSTKPLPDGLRLAGPPPAWFGSFAIHDHGNGPRMARVVAGSDGSPTASLMMIPVLPHPRLRHALERNEIKILFQPIVRLEDRTVAGFEALMRWDHPKHGRLGPQEFIGIAEETGNIRELTEWTLERALADRAALSASGKDVIVGAEQVAAVVPFQAGAAFEMRQSPTKPWASKSRKSFAQNTAMAAQSQVLLQRVGTVPVDWSQYGPCLFSKTFLTSWCWAGATPGPDGPRGAMASFPSFPACP